MQKGIIYCITNIVNGKRYIGQTIESMDFRFKTHIWDSKNPRRNKFSLHKAITKYGEAKFIVGQIEETDIDLLNEREIHWIKKLDTYKSGYNETVGGGGTRGYFHSDQTKKKISDSQKGKIIPLESRLKMSKAQKGKIQSEESKNKKRASMIGKNRGSKNGNSKLKDHEVFEIRISSKKGKDLAKIYGVAESTVSSIRNGTRRK